MSAGGWHASVSWVGDRAGTDMLFLYKDRCICDDLWFSPSWCVFFLLALFCVSSVVLNSQCVDVANYIQCASNDRQLNARLNQILPDTEMLWKSDTYNSNDIAFFSQWCTVQWKSHQLEQYTAHRELSTLHSVIFTVPSGQALPYCKYFGEPDAASLLQMAACHRDDSDRVQQQKNGPDVEGKNVS